MERRTVTHCSQAFLCQRLSPILVDMLKNTSCKFFFSVKITCASKDLAIMLLNITQLLLTEMGQSKWVRLTCARTDAHQVKYQRVMHLTKADGKQQYKSTSQFYEENKPFIFNYAEQFMGLAICIRPCTGQNRFGGKILLCPPPSFHLSKTTLPYFQSLLNFVFVSLHQCIVIFCSGLHLTSK